MEVEMFCLGCARVHFILPSIVEYEMDGYTAVMLSQFHENLPTGACILRIFQMTSYHATCTMQVN